MTLDELLGKLPTSLQPWATKYGPVFVQWTSQQVADWLDTIIKGDIGAAYASVLKSMSNQQAVDEWAVLSTEWKTANKQNAENLAAAKTALASLMKILITIALAAVGL